MPYKDLDKKITRRTARIKSPESTITPEQFEELRKCARDPVYFSSYAFITHPVQGKIPFALYDVQKPILGMFASHLLNIVLKSRQMGISWLTALFVTWLANFYSEKNILMISIKKSAAKRLLDKVKYIYDHLPMWMRVPVVEDTQTVLLFSNGSRIESIPTSEDAGRSEGVSLLVIDETASVRWIKEIWKAAYPTLSTGGMCILVSTPKGFGGFFQECWADAVAGKNNFNPILAPWWQHPIYSAGLKRIKTRAHDGRVVQKYWSPWYAKMAKDLGPLATAQELDCEFLTSGANYFDLQILISRFDYTSKNAVYQSRWNGDLRIFKKPQPDGHYVMGIDTASGHGKDYSWAIIRDYVTHEQVATYKTQSPVNLFAQRCTELAWFYNGAFVVGEENGVSIATLLQMRDTHQYPEDLFFYDTSLTDRDHEPTSRFGWNNNVKSRAHYLSKLEQMVREEAKTFKDPRAISEYMTFIVKENGRKEAMEEKNDDAVFADLCCLIGLENFSPYGMLPFKVA